MDIRLTCTQCTTTFQVDADRVGRQISCPNCFKRIYVEPPAIDDDTTGEPSEGQEYRLAPLEELPSRTDPLDSSREPLQPDKSAISTSEQPAVPIVPRPPVETPVTSDPPPITGEARCPKCDTPLAPGKEHCHACFYHVGLGRIVNTLDEDDPVAGEYGFRRLLLDKLQKDQSPESVFFLLDILIVLASVLTAVVNFGFALFVIPIALIYIVYRAAVWTGRLSYSGRSVLWRLVLFFGRVLKWRTWGGTDRQSITVRGQQFGDGELAQLENLDALQVLDLEKTAITDKGLAALKHQREITFLVLRKTRVTVEGVWELQQTIPQACIWY